MRILYKTISTILIAIIFLQSFLFAIPTKTSALFGLGDVVFDPTNTAQTTITASNTTASTITIFGINFKESVLDGIAYTLAKIVIRQITTDIVTWINNGFEGNPSFLSDPGGFFMNLIDEEVGMFIEGTDLGFLCEAWSIDIRIALALRFTPFKKNVTCRLSEIVGNAENAVENFTRGNFTDGGWDAWISVTTDPGGNPYTSYVESSNELSIRIAGQDLVQERNLLFNNGFLSWTKCVRYKGQEVAPEGTSSDPEAGSGATLPAEGTVIGGTGTEEDKPECLEKQVQTPGKVISDGLENVLGSPIRELELADEFNEIINALVVQLITQVFGGGNGLRGTSGSSTVDTSSILYRLKQGEGTQNVESIRTETLKAIQRDLLTESAYRAEINTSAIVAKQQYDIVEEIRMCFQNKLNEDRKPSLTPTQRTFGEEKAQEADDIAKNIVAPYMIKFNDRVAASDRVLNILNRLEKEAIAATSTLAINTTVFEYNDIAFDNRQIHSETDRVYAIEERDIMYQEFEGFGDQIYELRSACSVFPNAIIRN